MYAIRSYYAVLQSARRARLHLRCLALVEPMDKIRMAVQRGGGAWHAFERSPDVRPFSSQGIQIDVTTGTWMNLDVSPDGKEIAFDRLGDIYVMPITGGRATLLRGGPAWESQPRFSPDGMYISYTSDKSGGDNIWYRNNFV